MKPKKFLEIYRNFLDFEEFLGIQRNFLEFEEVSWNSKITARNAMPRDGTSSPFVVKPMEFNAFGVGRNSLDSKENP